jgi:MFS family permease
VSGELPTDRSSARPPVALIILLGAALLINYVDRGTMSIAAPLLEKQLGLTPIQLGWLQSVFYFAYVPAQPLMGWLADSVGAARVLAAGFLLWSASTVAAGLSRGVVGLLAARWLMGMGESVTYPSALALLAQRVTNRHRARATGVLQLGGMVGPTLGTFVGGLLMVRYGWRTMFIALGLASLLWLIPWFRQMRAAPVQAAPNAATYVSPRYVDILRQRALWGTMLGNFCSNYAFYFVFTTLPLYLVHERGLSLLNMTYLTTGFYAMESCGVLLSGWALDAWMQRGASASQAYKSALVVSAAGVGACLLASSTMGLTGATLLLLAAGAMDGLNAPAVCSLVQHFAGPRASGRWMGVQNALSNTAGMIAPVVAGYLAVATGHYDAALWVAGAVALSGVVSWLLIVPPVRPVEWSAGEAGAAPVSGLSGCE